MNVITSKDLWNESIEGAKYDFYHTWDYHELAFYNGEGKPYLFLFCKNGTKLALPLLLRDIDNLFFDFTSVYGYPGFIVFDEHSISIVDDFLNELKIWCYKHNIVSVYSRLNNLICDVEKIESSGDTVFINLADTLDEQWKSYRKNNRNLVNKLKRENYSCSWDNSEQSLLEFIDIYNNTMHLLNASEYYFFDYKYYTSLLNATDYEVRIYNCFLENTKVCSGMFIFCNGIVQYHLSGTVDEFKKYAPNRLMLDTVRVDATKEGYQFFHLGGGLGGKHDGLFDFKYAFSKKTVSFKMLKLITNMSKYLELSNINECDFNSIKEDFFPLYRKK